MDKFYKDRYGQKNAPEQSYEKNGFFTVMLTLALICVSFSLFNLSLILKDGESEGACKIGNAVLAAAENLEENEAVSVFLGLENYYEYDENGEYDEKKFY